MTERIMVSKLGWIFAAVLAAGAGVADRPATAAVATSGTADIDRLAAEGAGPALAQYRGHGGYGGFRGGYGGYRGGYRGYHGWGGRVGVYRHPGWGGYRGWGYRGYGYRPYGYRGYGWPYRRAYWGYGRPYWGGGYWGGYGWPSYGYGYYGPGFGVGVLSGVALGSALYNAPYGYGRSCWRERKPVMVSGRWVRRLVTVCNTW